jgi:dephospho-CoA kinase
MVVGITGGLATGKSEVARMLEARGAVVFSADQASRAVLSPGGPVARELVGEFGPAIITEDGGVDRAALGRLIFADADARERLNRITHPAILALLRAQIDAARDDLPASSIIVVEAPLLFEANIASWFERIIVVTASEPTQIARLRERNGFDEAEAKRRIEAQWPVAEKAARADHVIRNEGSPEELEVAVERVWESMKQYESISHPNRSGEKKLLHRA